MYFLPPASLHDVEDLVAPCRLGAKSGSVSDFTPKTKVGSQGVFFLVSKKNWCVFVLPFLGVLKLQRFFPVFYFFVSLERNVCILYKSDGTIPFVLELSKGGPGRSRKVMVSSHCCGLKG